MASATCAWRWFDAGCRTAGRSCSDELQGAACARGHHPVVEAVVGESRGEPVVRHAAHVPIARGSGHADVGREVADRREMRLQAGGELALPDRLAAERVADLVVGQRPRHDVEDATTHGRPVHRPERRPGLAEVGRPARLEHGHARGDHLEIARGVGRSAAQGRLGVAAGGLVAALLHGLPRPDHLEIGLARLGDRREDVPRRIEQSVAKGEAGHLAARATAVRGEVPSRRTRAAVWSGVPAAQRAETASCGSQPCRAEPPRTSRSRRRCNRPRDQSAGPAGGAPRRRRAGRDRLAAGSPPPASAGSHTQRIGSAGSPGPAPRTEGTWLEP